MSGARCGASSKRRPTRVRLAAWRRAARGTDRAGIGILIGPAMRLCRGADYSIARLAGASMDTDIRGSGAAWGIATTMRLGTTAMDSVAGPGAAGIAVAACMAADMAVVGTADTAVEAGIGKVTSI